MDMKKLYVMLLFCLPVTMAYTQTTIQFPPDVPGHKTELKVFPNPTQQRVQVKVNNWDIKYRYTVNVLNSNGKRLSTKILQHPIETIELNAGSRRKATLFVEVWKEKTLVGRETVVVIR
jgi:hypothetical protein